MKVCVVGASGVLGRALVPLLVGKGHSVLALARFSKMRPDFFPPEVERVAFDLLSENDGKNLPSLLTGCDAVVHAATRIPVDFMTPGAWDENTRLRTEGTQRLVDASLAAGVKIYVQQSISMAYPDMGDQWIDEHTLLDASPERSGICAPVMAMENSVRAIPPESMRWCILRGGMFVGKGTFQDVQIEMLRAGKDVVPGNGGSFVSYVHVNDMASAIVAAIERAPNASVFNINAAPVRQGDYADTLAETIGAPKPRRDSAKPNPPSFRCSNEAAKIQLGWVPQHSISPERIGIKENVSSNRDATSRPGHTKNQATRQREHPLFIRVSHWANFIALGIMVTSGFRIYNASPIWDFRIPETFTLGGWLGGARPWHFFGMWILAVNGVAYVAYNILTRHGRRTTLFNPSDARGVLPMILYYLRIRKEHPPQQKYNALQKLAYTSIPLLGLGSIMSGIAIYWPVQFSGVTSVFGGYEYARMFHFFCTAMFVLFTGGHLFMVAISGWSNFLSMITGWKKNAPTETAGAK